MDTSKLNSGQRQLRMNIRNFFLTATHAELESALPTYPDQFSKDCIRELMEEADCPVCENLGCGRGAGVSHTYNSRCLCRKA